MIQNEKILLEKEKSPLNSNLPPIISSLWSELLNEIENIDKLNILEFAGGSKPKVAANLKDKFESNYFLIDANPVVNSILAKKYIKLMPNANIIQMDDTLINSSEIIKNVDVVVANHALDDLISFELCKIKSLSFPRCNKKENIRLLKELYNSSSKEEINCSIEEALDHLLNSFKNLNPKRIILSNYPSNSFHEANFDLPFLYSEILKKKLAIELAKAYIVDIKIIGNASRYEGGWLICKKK